MASCSSLLSEEQVMCSICLEVLTEPVSIPCGHNFCKVCISNYWDTTDLCQFPLCQDTFSRRPELCVNTAFRDVAENVKRRKIKDDEKSPAGPGDVPCDICTGTKVKALKSCPVCQTSYCETHLEPHRRVAALKKHKLIHPVENLDKMCKKHDRLLEFFCRKYQMCVCVMCMKTDHKTHDTVSLEEECGQRKTKLGKMKTDNDQMMETRSIKVQQMRRSVETSKRDAEREISASVEAFTALVRCIQRSQDEFIQVIEKKQKTAEKQAECFIIDLEQEITELKMRSSELEKLSQSEDNIHIIQTFPSLSSRLHTKDWSQISVQSDLGVAVRKAVSQMEDTLMKNIKKLCEAELKRIQPYETAQRRLILSDEAELKRIQQFAADVTLDPETANPKFILSGDGKQVRCGSTRKNLPYNPKRFDPFACVLGKQSFSSGRFYYEVEVEGNSALALGVVRESINRKGTIRASVKIGWWVIVLRNGDEYTARDNTDVHLSLTEKPRKVEVFVDYEEGRVSFYNVEARSHIYTFAGCSFTEKLYPLLNHNGKNSAIMTISPVTHTA